MTLCDFIGAKAQVDGQEITILYVGKELNYVMFGYMEDGILKTINSARCSLKVQYNNRPALHGETSFIGPNLVSAKWYDEDGKLIKKGGYKIMDAPLSDLKIVQ